MSMMRRGMVVRAGRRQAKTATRAPRRRDEHHQSLPAVSHDQHLEKDSISQERMNQQPHIVADDQPSDVDSALGSDISSLTQSLRESLLESVEENGRGYHRYSSVTGGQYPLPEDDLEQERGDLQHQIFLYTFNGKLHLSPIVKDNIRNCLDLGTGTGIWAIDFADENPHAQVVGTDLSPIQPNFVPPNCRFEIDDFNADWTFAQNFDFIHARALVGSSKDFPGIIKQAYDGLNPGGWLEMSDVQMPFESDDGTMEGTNLKAWTEKQVEACTIGGVDTRAPSKYKQWMIEQGFENVTEHRFKWPVGTWPKDKHMKLIGKLTRANFLAGLEGFTLRLWTGALGLTPEEVLVQLAFVRKDISNPRIHCYWPIYSVYGQKPANA